MKTEHMDLLTLKTFAHFPISAYIFDRTYGPEFSGSSSNNFSAAHSPNSMLQCVLCMTILRITNNHRIP
jgi:hypothetical protein